MNALDPKPWFCTSCSDRFVREQGVDSPTSHVTKFRPRPEYEQDRSKYPVTIHDSAGFPLYTIPPDGEIDPMDDYDLSSGGK